MVIDRSTPLKDITVYNCTLPFVHTAEDKWDCELKINNAILALKRRGGGPVHINVQQNYSRNFDVTELPAVNKINRFTYEDSLPELPEGKLCIWVGNHKKMNASLTQAIDNFCEKNDAVVFTDHTSGYQGKYRVNYALVEQQLQNTKENPDLMIYIGDVSGAYYGRAKNVWRVNPDGEFRDLFKKLRNVFEMSEEYFFNYYGNHSRNKNSINYYSECKKRLNRIREQIPETLPFSNLWCAKETASRLPENSCVHLGILNSLRCWNFFDFPQGVEGYSNTGGFGIDGGLSSCVGACLANPERIHFMVIGDLAFFYDMNVLGNRHVLKNIRVLLINNGRGTEFTNFDHPGAAFGVDADSFIAAAGHYGKQSRQLIKHYAEDLGFEYLTASSKEEYLLFLPHFLEKTLTEKPILFEIFTDSTDESKALQVVKNLDADATEAVKTMAKRILGKKGVSAAKKLLGKT